MATVKDADTVELEEPATPVVEKRRVTKINRSAPLYLRRSVTRLSVIADRPLKTREDICAALEEYGYCLPPEQREALEKYCGLI